MSHVPARLSDFLDQNSVPYDVIRHWPDARARDAALHAHIPAPEFAKTVLVRVAGQNAMVVLPASQSLSIHRLRSALRVPSVVLMAEPETAELFPDCDLGAAPPFGNLYGLPVYASPALQRHEHISFNAGTHEHVIRMRYADYERLVQPHVVHMARREALPAGPSAGRPMGQQ